MTPLPTREASFLNLDRYGVLGAARSGQAAAALLLELGKTVTLFDDFAREDDPACQALAQNGVRLRFGTPGAPGAPGGDLEAVQALVCSPGIPLGHALLQAAARRGLPVVAEVELGWLCAPRSRFAAVTGTNG